MYTPPTTYMETTGTDPVPTHCKCVVLPINTKSPMMTQTANCELCDSKFTAKLSEVKRGNGRFCSKRCSATFNARNAAYKRDTPPPNVSCAYCDVEFRISPNKFKLSKSGLYFCCREHKDRAQCIGGKLKPVHYGTSKKGVGTTYRRIAFLHHPPKCASCGYDKRTEVLEVHHVDRDRSNNDPSNLRILCPTCHMTEHLDSLTGRYSKTKRAVGE